MIPAIDSRLPPLAAEPVDAAAAEAPLPLCVQWCDTAPPQLNSEGVDYCAPAKTYKGVDLTFDNLVDPKEV